jgi:hypothetical protein
MAFDRISKSQEIRPPPTRGWINRVISPCKERGHQAITASTTRSPRRRALATRRKFTLSATATSRFRHGANCPLWPTRSHRPRRFDRDRGSRRKAWGILVPIERRGQACENRKRARGRRRRREGHLIPRVADNTAAEPCAAELVRAGRIRLALFPPQYTKDSARSGEPSSAPGVLSPVQSYADCITGTRGFDFREGQRSPHIFQRSRSGVSLRAGGEFAVELGEE